MAGQPRETETIWRRILTLKRPGRFCSVDQDTYGHPTLRKPAAVAAERGDHNQARRFWEAVLTQCPGDTEAVAKLRD